MILERTPSDNLKLLFLEQIVTVWKRKRLVLAVMWFVCVAGWAGVMLIPQRFESNARAFIDVNGLLTPLLKGLIVNTTPAESENYLRQTLLSRPNLEQAIVIANLASPDISEVRRQQLVDTLAAHMKVSTDGENLVSIGYSNSNPIVARNVVDALLTIFAEKATTSSRAEMEKARRFLNGQIAQYATQLRDGEHLRAEFRKKYAPFFNESGVARPELMQQQLKQLDQQYEDAVTTRNALAAELKQVPALLSVGAAPTVSSSGEIVSASPEVRLAQAKRRLSDLRLLYTDRHPDVVEAERTVSDLHAELGAKEKTGGAAAGKTQISNPTYEQLRLKLVDAQTVIPTLKERLERATAEYSRVKALSAELPEVQAKSLDLDRDYEVLKQQYDELVKRRESANLSQAADDRADRTQFRIVDPPQVPLAPSFPDRALLLSVAALIGLVAGIGAPILLARFHRTYGTARGLREFGLPVIGAVTYVSRNSGPGEASTMSGGFFAAATVSLLVAFAAVMLFATNLKSVW